MVEVPREAGIALWKGSVGRLVDPYNQQVPAGWRDQVVKLAATGRQAEAIETIKAKLIEVQDPYSPEVGSGASEPWMAATRDEGIAAWLNDQVQADALKHSASVALGASPHLTHSTAGTSDGARTGTQSDPTTPRQQGQSR